MLTAIKRLWILRTVSDTFKVKPSQKLRDLVEIYGGVNITAERWGIEYGSLKRFLKGEQTLSLPVAGRIVEKSGLTYEELFEHEIKPEAKR